MRISVFGIGYVGVVSCGCLAELGHEVIGVDISNEKIAMLAAGRSPIVEETIGALIADAVRLGLLTATDSVEHAVSRTEVSFISVGTPSAPDGSVALGAVDAVTSAIGRAVRAKPRDRDSQRNLHFLYADARICRRRFVQVHGEQQRRHLFAGDRDDYGHRTDAIYRTRYRAGGKRRCRL